MCVEDKYVWQWTKQHQRITDVTESHDKKLKQKNMPKNIIPTASKCLTGEGLRVMTSTGSVRREWPWSAPAVAATRHRRVRWNIWVRLIDKLQKVFCHLLICGFENDDVEGAMR